MGIIKSFLMCLSMYTTISVKDKLELDNKNLKYTLFFLPVIGIILGIIEYYLYFFSIYLNISSILYGALATAIVILFTGGIHLDGYMDTIDAHFSYGDIEKKREILKDAHVGAFAVIYLILYLLLLFATFENMYKVNASLFIFILIFTISRIFCLYLIATIKPSENQGLLYTFSSNKNKKALFIYSLILTSLFFILIDYKFLLLLLLMLIIISITLKKYFQKIFWGISGDLAGFSICIYEISVLLFVNLY